MEDIKLQEEIVTILMGIAQSDYSDVDYSDLEGHMTAKAMDIIKMVREAK